MLGGLWTREKSGLQRGLGVEAENGGKRKEESQVWGAVSSEWGQVGRVVKGPHPRLSLGLWLMMCPEQSSSLLSALSITGSRAFSFTPAGSNISGERGGSRHSASVKRMALESQF